MLYETSGLIGMKRLCISDRPRCMYCELSLFEFNRTRVGYVFVHAKCLHKLVDRNKKVRDVIGLLRDLV